MNARLDPTDGPAPAPLPVVPFAALAAQRWYAVPDLDVGGYAVANVDKPTADIDQRAGDRRVAWGLWEETARYVVALHNAHREALDELARTAAELNPEDYDEDSPEGKYDLAYDEGHRVGSISGREPLVVAIREAMDDAREAEDAAGLFDIIEGLAELVEHEPERPPLPDNLERVIYDATESIGWWDVAKFLAERPEAARSFLEQVDPDLLVAEEGPES
jgi:hypothetical protein